MFEEIPRKPRGFAGLGARRFVLGPFIIGGGVVLCTVGGSAALAATVITASSIGLDELPPYKNHRPDAASTSTQSRIERVAAPSTSRSAHPTATRAGTNPEAPRPRPTDPASTPGSNTSTTDPTTAPKPSTTAVQPATSVASASTPSPNGNAVVYIFGYDQDAQRLKFAYAELRQGGAPGGGDLYVVNDPTPYSAGIASDIRITSGGTICPPAGSACTPDELIAAADAGLFAQVAIDADGNLKVVVEEGAPAKSATSQAPSGPPSEPAPTPSVDS
jgi:hypothetical protein